MNEKQKKQRNIFHNQLLNLAESIDINQLSEDAQDDIKAALKHLRSDELSPKQYTAVAMKLSAFMDISKRGDIELYQQVYDRA